MKTREIELARETFSQANNCKACLSRYSTFQRLSNWWGYHTPRCIIPWIGAAEQGWWASINWICFSQAYLIEAELIFWSAETLACVRACEHWRVYVWRRQFILRTYSGALVKLLSTKVKGDCSSRLRGSSQTADTILKLNTRRLTSALSASWVTCRRKREGTPFVLLQHALLMRRLSLKQCRPTLSGSHKVSDHRRHKWRRQWPRQFRSTGCRLSSQSFDTSWFLVAN